MKLKPQLSIFQIINMNVGFFGIQYSFGLQQSAVNPIYDLLGASPDQIPLLNLAGPLTGLFVQPIIGAISDKTWHPKLGRRKPFFLLGAILCSIALFFFPFSSSLWFATGMLWILDIGNNMAMEPYRAFVTDKLQVTQQHQGFLIQSFFTGFGQTLANLSLFIFPLIIVGKTGSIPNWVFASFFLGAICSIGSILWSMYTTPESISEEEKEFIKNNKLSILTPLKDIIHTILNLPKSLKLLALVYLFQWYALFCYWQYSSKTVAQNCFAWVDMNSHSAEQSKKLHYFSEFNSFCSANYLSRDSMVQVLQSQTIPIYMNGHYFETTEIDDILFVEKNNRQYEKAISWTGLVNGFYNIITFISAILLILITRRYHPKYIHAICLTIAGIGFIFFANSHNPYLLFLYISGFGIAWASIMAVPYLLITRDIPPNQNGIFMGIINMMIVIPMFIQTTTFGWIMKNIFHNNSHSAVVFAGILLMISAILCMFFKTKAD